MFSLTCLHFRWRPHISRRARSLPFSIGSTLRVYTFAALRVFRREFICRFIWSGACFSSAPPPVSYLLASCFSSLRRSRWHLWHAQSLHPCPFSTPSAASAASVARMFSIIFCACCIISGVNMFGFIARPPPPPPPQRTTVRVLPLSAFVFSALEHAAASRKHTLQKWRF